MFDQTKVLTDLEPIRGFKAFLYKYVDEAALARRTSQTEDDNPPSPLTMDLSPSSAMAKDMANSRGEKEKVAK